MNLEITIKQVGKTEKGKKAPPLKRVVLSDEAASAAMVGIALSQFDPRTFNERVSPQASTELTNFSRALADVVSTVRG